MFVEQITRAAFLDFLICLMNGETYSGLIPNMNSRVKYVSILFHETIHYIERYQVEGEEKNIN